MSRSGKAQEADNALVQSFTSVRRALGLLALALPPMLLLVVLVTHEVPRSSISAYYYGPAGNILVGSLCAMAVFLWSYLGYEHEEGHFPSDKLISRLAAAAVLIVAFVPMGTLPAATSANCTFVECVVLWIPGVNPSIVHLAAALCYFAFLAVFCLVNFRRTGDLPMSQEKRTNNRIYLICGLVIVACLVLLVWRGYRYHVATPEEQAAMTKTLTVFYLESIAVWAFSAAWLVKGEIHKAFRRA